MRMRGAEEKPASTRYRFTRRLRRWRSFMTRTVVHSHIPFGEVIPRHRGWDVGRDQGG